MTTHLMTVKMHSAQVTSEKHVTLYGPVSAAQWANALSEPQCTARPDWLETCDGLGSIPGRGVGFLVGWTNSCLLYTSDAADE